MSLGLLHDHSRSFRALAAQMMLRIALVMSQLQQLRLEAMQWTESQEVCGKLVPGNFHEFSEFNWRNLTMLQARYASAAQRRRPPAEDAPAEPSGSEFIQPMMASGEIGMTASHRFTNLLSLLFQVLPNKMLDSQTKSILLQCSSLF